jgi:hypothetical protein
MEQRELERKFGKKKAKEVAQQNFEVDCICTALYSVDFGWLAVFS